MNRRQRRRRARIKRALLLGPPTLAAGLALVGFWFPPLHREHARVELPSSPETVWTVLTDLDAMPSWRDDVEAVERLPDAHGLVRWHERRGGAELAFQRVEAVAPIRMVVEEMGARRGERRWIYRINPVADGSELQVTEERRIRNPMLRPLVYLWGGDRDWIERLSRNLAARVNARRQQLVSRPSL